MDNVNPNALNDNQLSLWNQIRAHLSFCAINRGPHGWELELCSPSTCCNDFNFAGPQQMVTFNTPKVVPKLRPGVWDIVFHMQGQHLSEMALRYWEVYQRESKPVPVLLHADKCCQLGEIYCHMGEIIRLVSSDSSSVVLSQVFNAFNLSFQCSELKIKTE